MTRAADLPLEARAKTHLTDGFGMPRCQTEEKVAPEDLVEAALHAACTDCRNMVLVGPPGQTGCALSEPPRYTPEPYPGADTTLADKQARVDAR